MNFVTTYIFPYANFFLFLAILVYLARKPLKALVEKKRVEFDQRAKEATALRADAEQRLANINQRMSGLSEELSELQQSFQAQTKIECQKIIESGEEAAKRLKKDVERLGEAELIRAKQELNSQILLAVKKEVVKQLQEDFKSEDQARYMKSSIKDLASNKLALNS